MDQVVENSYFRVKEWRPMVMVKESAPGFHHSSWGVASIEDDSTEVTVASVTRSLFGNRTNCSRGSEFTD